MDAPSPSWQRLYADEDIQLDLAARPMNPI